jgi:adenine-specific DNA-methyltransferase
MISARIRLSKRLLSNNGVLFVSIDDNERDNIKKVIDEAFGEASFVASVIWRKKASPDARSTIGSVHDYLLCYVNNPNEPKAAIGKMALSESRKASFSNPDSDPRGPWASVDMTGMIGRATKDQFFKVKLPSGREITPPSGRSWGLIEKTFQELRNDNRVWFGVSGDNVPRIKRFLSEVEGQTVPTYWSYDEVGSNEDASNELLELFDHPKLFDTPKPTRLIDRLLEISTNADEPQLVLDFFAGSSTTAHSVIRANAKDGGRRRFIMVQAAEPVGEKSEAKKLGYAHIAELSKERIRRAGKEILEGEFHEEWNKDIGFRVLKTDTSNMADVYYAPDALDKAKFDLFVDNIKPDRTPEDLLFQVMLDWGVDLTLPISKEIIKVNKDEGGRMEDDKAVGGDSSFSLPNSSFKEYEVYKVDENSLIACFDASGSIDEAFVKELAKHQPLRVVFRDAGYKNSAVKINVEQIFKLLSPATEVKCI